MERLVRDFVRALTELPQSRAPRAPRMRRRRQQQAAPQSSMQPRAAPRRRRRRARNNQRIPTEGSMTLTKDEIAISVKADGQGKASGYIDLVPKSFPLLNNVYKAFERVKWERLHFYWRPAVGTTEGGLLTYGIDWDWSDPVSDRVKVASYTPSCSHAIWSDRSPAMIVPASKLQSRAWYTPSVGDNVDKGPGRLVYSAVGPANKDLGEIWVSYTLLLAGTHA